METPEVNTLIAQAVAEATKELKAKLKAAEARVRELTEAFEKEPKQPKTFADNLDDYL